MGETKQTDGITKKQEYRSRVEFLQTKARENFNEMDFENADKRDCMETCVETIEEIASQLLADIDSVCLN